MVFDKVRELLAEQLGLDAETITMESNIVADLRADSLDIVEMLMTMEDSFGIQVEEEAANQLLTVGALVQYVEKALK